MWQITIFEYFVEQWSNQPQINNTLPRIQSIQIIEILSLNWNHCFELKNQIFLKHKFFGNAGQRPTKPEFTRMDEWRKKNCWPFSNVFFISNILKACQWIMPIIFQFFTALFLFCWLFFFFGRKKLTQQF